MTLLIACLLIHHAGLGAWWYALATLLWVAHLAAHDA
jgi:hypothetical protein